MLGPASQVLQRGSADALSLASSDLGRVPDCPPIMLLILKSPALSANLGNQI